MREPFFAVISPRLNNQETIEEFKKEVNQHVERIRDSVFHSYPYQSIPVTSDTPHAEDCEGCLINREVTELVNIISELIDVKIIMTELEHERKAREMLSTERHEAFKRAGVPEEGSVADLVGSLVDGQYRLSNLLHTITRDLSSTVEKLRQEKF